jgi:hypothetical protein
MNCQVFWDVTPSQLAISTEVSVTVDASFFKSEIFFLDSFALEVFGWCVTYIRGDFNLHEHG